MTLSIFSTDALYLKADAFFFLHFLVVTLHSHGHFVNLMSPVFQSISGLCFCNQVYPIMTVDFPRSHTSNTAFSLCPLCDSIKVTSCVIEPPWLRVPSILYTRIGLSSNHIAIPFPSANFLSINIPVAPLSSSAFTSTMRWVSMVHNPTLIINSDSDQTVQTK